MTITEVHTPIFEKNVMKVSIQVPLSFCTSVALSFIHLTLENVVKFVMNLLQPWGDLNSCIMK
jgi:hypothetical protein